MPLSAVPHRENTLFQRIKYRGTHGNLRLGRACKTYRPRPICSAQGTKNPLPSGTGSVKPEVNIYCQGNGKGSNAGHLGGFKDTENQVGVVSSEIFQKEAGCAV